MPKVEAPRASKSSASRETPTRPPEDPRYALYAAPLAEFVAVRAKLARELRIGGDPAAARALLASPKPSAAAWAVNQLARGDLDGLRTLVRLRQAASRVQASGEGAEVRGAIAAYRAQLDALVSKGEKQLVHAGAGAPVTLRREIRACLEAGAQDPDGAGARVLEGQLVKSLHVENAFVGLSASGGKGHLRVVPRADRLAPRPLPATPRPPPQRTEARVESAPASTALRDADRAAQQALDALLAHAVAALTSATAEAEKAQERRDRADAELRDATADVEAAEALVARATKARDGLGR